MSTYQDAKNSINNTSKNEMGGFLPVNEIDVFF